MGEMTPKGVLGFAICLTVALVGQLILILRYIKRLPNDTFGIALFIVTLVIFAVLAVFHYAKWASARKAGE